MRKPFTETLKLLQGGAFLELCTDLLAETVTSVDETGKGGKLVLTLDIKKANGAIAVHAKATNKVPEPVADADLLWATAEGNLTPSNPNQRTLDLVPTGVREVQSVDKATGEISFAGAKG